jgi:hypothetical protein
VPVVEVDQRGIWLVGIDRGTGAVGVGERLSAEFAKPIGKGRYRRVVLIDCGAGVLIGGPVPAQAHGLHRHSRSVRQTGVSHRRRSGRPSAAGRDESALLLKSQPVGDVDRAGSDLHGGARQERVHQRFLLGGGVLGELAVVDEPQAPVGSGAAQSVEGVCAGQRNRQRCIERRRRDGSSGIPVSGILESAAHLRPRVGRVADDPRIDAGLGEPAGRLQPGGRVGGPVDHDRDAALETVAVG